MIAPPDAPATVCLFALDGLPGVTLDELDALAERQTRTERKYLVSSEHLAAAMELLPVRPRVLDIDDRRRFRYESIYFDTPGFDSYLDAARRRPQRFKVRTRTYVDAGRCWIEAKFRTRTGRTEKRRAEIALGDGGRLSEESLAFLDGFPLVRPHLAHLGPALRTRYGRSTLVLGSSRVTIDVDLDCSVPGRSAGGVGVGDLIIIETKGDRAVGDFDRALWSLHVRPSAISKYGLGMAALHPHLPSNAWRRILDRHVAPTL